ncbi:MAG TPA: carbohydrate ABC transporter permease [Candidatus Eisenbergiella merdavium]|uniref:Carbohydrate ABC transporter permease n=1 Tax=Candidatus Eisenbergiella merdavium TaxID=2838551 RepID=A0A9D2NGW1_9FIRM|nr:carbohydrate ABC transporter permease [Candidatus Eisenbergiella merdavium]
MITDKKGIHAAIHAVMCFLSLVCIVPFILLVICSFTEENALINHGYSFFPESLSLAAYRYLLSAGEKILRSYGVSILVTAVGTCCNVAMTVLLAYPLSRRRLRGRTAVSFYLFFTMLFHGGLVPSYMMWTQTFHIKDTLAALIVPNLMLNPFYVIIMRTSFSTGIPEEILEAARIDGAGEFRVLKKIVLPLSRPMISTIGLLAGLAYWNDWQNGLYYLVRRTDLYGIQNLLNRMISNAEFLNTQTNVAELQAAGAAVPSVGIRMAVAVVALVPILAVYPFFQRSFVKGIMIGGVKG